MSTDLEDWIELADEKTETAEMARERGDRLEKRGRTDEAQSQFSIGLADLEITLETFPLSLTDADAWGYDVHKVVSKRLIEILGSRGGLLRRTGDVPCAFESYDLGAKIEELSGSKVTYNRLNVIKNSIIMGTKKIDEIRSTVEATAAQMDQNLNTKAKTNAGLTDKGWPWADLGDCYLILGDLVRAEEAYKDFFNRIEPSSRQKPISVLQNMREALAKEDDPSSVAAIAAIDTIIGRLEAGNF